ncbi:Sel1 repeat family protein [Rhizophagus irregularis DAOM 181602=DAOM 197198]|nr:Sel1 repeat family protein [Rhizophagus irregularis DAOM 181602=DAOM 197198]
MILIRSGIGCKVDKIKSLEIFDSIKKEGTITETITLRDVGVYDDDDDDDNDDVDNNNDNNDNNNDDDVDNDIKKDYNKAIEWYSKSSSGGNIKAMYMLGGYNIASFMVGNCYHYGNGILKDEYQAFEWYLKSAKKGYNYCQYIVSNYYNDGLYVKKNEKKGFYWNRKSAINGYIYAQHKLAKYYFDDTINKNQSKALKWYLVLSNKNSFDAIHLVSKCYRDGIGTDRNFPEAIKWFEKTLYY